MSSSLILLGIVGVIALVVWTKYNAIVSNDNLVQRAWADVIAQERQRSRIIPELERILSSHKEFESEILPKIVALRSGLDGVSEQRVEPGKLNGITSASRDLFSSLRVQVENYPELRSDASFGKMMAEITNQEDNVGAALRIFNQNVEQFNSSIEIFPNNIVNAFFNKQKPVDTFYDSEASSSFEYKPNF